MNIFPYEHARILWRQSLLAMPEGRAWLIAHVREKEQKLGPQHPDWRPHV